MFDHDAISRISILEDLKNYRPDCNSVHTQKGFAMAIRKGMDEDQKRLVVFMLTSSMQVAFLSSDCSKKLLGFDLAVKEERDSYIDKIVKILLGDL